MDNYLRVFICFMLGAFFSLLFVVLKNISPHYEIKMYDDGNYVSSCRGTWTDVWKCRNKSKGINTLSVKRITGNQ